MKQKLKLQDVEATLLIPVWSRSVETQNKKGIIVDNYSSRICNEVDFNFKLFDKSWKSQVGIAIRTKIIDNKVCDFLKENPDGNIVILGAGLDARAFRLDNNLANWFHIDFKNVIDLRANFFTSTKRHKDITSDVLKEEWIAEIPKDKKILFIAEGLIMYLDKQEVKQLFKNITYNFIDAEVLVEILSTRMSENTVNHDSVSKFNAVFKSGFNHSIELEKINPKLSFIKDWFYLDEYKEKWRFYRFIFLLPDRLKSARIAYFKIL